jgi:hypothetical protein
MERARWSKVLGSSAFASAPPVAAHLLASTDMPAEAIIGSLRQIAADAKAAPAAREAAISDRWGAAFKRAGVILAVTAMLGVGAAAPSPAQSQTPTIATGAAAPGVRAAVSTGLVATGTNGATALVLLAQTSVFAAVPPGSGCALNPDIVNGTFRVINTSEHDLLVYPPSTAQIGTNALGAAVIVPPGDAANFSTDAPATLWIAS